MLRMNQIDEIKELQRQGLGPQEIAGRLKLNRKTAAKYMKVEDFCLSFPHSNGGFVQTFGGETAECVCQGLGDIFRHIGGVPRRIVFDNAGGVGRRVRDKTSLNDLFLRFKCHYGFSVSFCNPDAGHEKGHVENKVGYVRWNLSRKRSGGRRWTPSASRPSRIGSPTTA